jgi:hypothetical protein
MTAKTTKKMLMNSSNGFETGFGACFGGGGGDVSITAVNLRCKRESLPFKNLGHLAMWKPVIDKISSRLSSSKGRHLSIGGRVCLVKLVLNNLPVYFLSMFPIPKKIATKIERKSDLSCGLGKRREGRFAM